MKKIFFSCLAIAAIASCAKTEPTFTEVDSEIKIAPVTAVSTKAVTGAIDGTEYPAAEAFKVYAHWNTAGAGSDFNSGTLYLNNVKFVNKGAYWGGETTYYWPKNGSLRFSAYSPAELNMAHDLSTDTYTLGTIEYPTAPANAYDILVAATSESYTAETAAEKVSVVFEHALSWISFNIQSTVVAEGVFDVKEVIVNNVAYKGGLVANMTAGTKVWTLGNDTNPVTVFTGSQEATATAASVDDNDNLVLPQAPTTVTIKYTQNEMSHVDANGNTVVDSPALANQVIEVPLVLDNADDTWEPGKHYTYTILFDLDEILINPTVEDWEETTEVIVNSSPVKVNTSAELVAAVAEGKDVVLEQSITLDEPVVVEPVVATRAATAFEVTIDLNGKDIIAPSSDAIIVDGGAHLTINGNGKVHAATDNATSANAVWVKHGNVTINGGDYFVGKDNNLRNDCIYVGASAYKDNAAEYESHLVINGGTFAAEVSPEDGKCWVLNLKDEFYRAGSTIKVYGGTFKSFDPAAGGTENPAANFVAEGYASYELETGVWTVAAKTAPVEVATAAALQDVVGQGGSAVLANDITMGAALVMSKNAVLDGNGYTLTSTPTGESARAINVSGGENVVIKNLTVVAPGQRAINIIQNTKNVQIENVTATAANYTVNVAGSASGAKVSIADSDLTGLCTINVGAVDVVVTVTNTKITCVDNNAAEHYGAITCNTEAVGSKVTVNGGEVVVNGDSYAANQAAAGSVIAFIGTKGSTSVKDAYFAIKYGNYAYTFVDFESALAVAKDGETITLLKDVTTNKTLRVENKKVTLDMNGKNLTVTNPGVDYTDGIKATTGAVLTITGNGTVNADWGAIVAMKDSKVVVESGTFYGNEGEVVFAQNSGSVEILGGTFKHNTDPKCTLNLYDRATASISVKGGSYYKFNPADNANEGEHTNFVAEGYKAVADGDWYTVVAE